MRLALALAVLVPASWALVFALAWLFSAVPGAWLLLGVLAVAWLFKERAQTVAERGRE
jgi:hypothetical protein